MNHTLTIFLFALLCAHCGPASSPSAPGYPCGTRGVACSTQPLSCCWQGEVCGGQPGSGCPAGMCCYGGESAIMAAKPISSGNGNTKQWR